MPLRGPQCSLLCSEAREDFFISDSNRVRGLSWDRGKPGATGWRGAHDASPENRSPTDGGGRAGGGAASGWLGTSRVSGTFSLLLLHQLHLSPQALDQRGGSSCSKGTGLQLLLNGEGRHGGGWSTREGPGGPGRLGLGGLGLAWTVLSTPAALWDTVMGCLEVR